MKSRTKPKTSDKPASPRKIAIARLVQSSEANIDDEAEDRQRGGVQSLGRAFSILEEVARHREGIGLADLSKLVGLHNSTTFHLAKTLVSLGYMRQERDSKRYRVGRPLFGLAASALDEIEMVNIATPDPGRPVAGNRQKRPARRAHGQRRGGYRPHQRARRVPTDRPGARGTPRALYGARQNRARLAPRPDQLKRFLEQVELKPSTKKSITEATVLLREIAEIRRSAIAFDNGEFNAEVRCVAVPVYNFTGEVIGALVISGPIWRMTDQALQSRAKLVQAAASRLSAEFGARDMAKSS